MRMKRIKLFKLVPLLLLALLISGAVFTVTPMAAAKKVKKISTVKKYNSKGELTRVYNIKYNKYGYVSKVTCKLYSQYQTNAFKTLKAVYTYKYNADKTLKKMTVDKENRKTVTTFTKKGLPKTSSAKEGRLSSKTTYKKGLPQKNVQTISGRTHSVTKYNSKGDVKTEQYYDDDGTVLSENSYTYKYKNGLKTSETKKVIAKREPFIETDKVKYTYDKHNYLKKEVWKATYSKNPNYKSENDDEEDAGEVYPKPSSWFTTYSNTYKNGLLTKRVVKYTDGPEQFKTTISYTKKKYPVRYSDYTSVDQLDREFIVAIG